MGLGLRVLGATEWLSSPNASGNSTGADMKAYEAVVDATHRYKGIFYENASSAAGGGMGGYDGAGDGEDESGGTVH